MITNREEVLENALRVFAKMNYEKASLVTIAKACGLSKWGLIYYYPFKQDLFNAVVEKYIFAMQDPEQKFSFEGGTLLEFIGHHVEGVERTMRRIVGLLDDGNNPQGCSYNFYYFHLLMQVRQYYPDAQAKFAELFEKDRKLWRDNIGRARRLAKSARTWTRKRRSPCSARCSTACPTSRRSSPGWTRANSAASSGSSIH